MNNFFFKMYLFSTGNRQKNPDKMAMNYRRQPKLPHKHEGRIAPYSKDGGRRAVERTGRNKDGKDGGPQRFRKVLPTLGEIESDKLTKLSAEFWAPHTLKSHKAYDPAVIDDIYKSDLNTEAPQRRVMLLEYSQYLENYLWPNFKVGRHEFDCTSTDGTSASAAWMHVHFN